MQLVWLQTTQISSVALASVSYTIHNINHAVMIILLVLNRCKLLAPLQQDYQRNDIKGAGICSDHKPHPKETVCSPSLYSEVHK